MVHRRVFLLAILLMALTGCANTSTPHSFGAFTERGLSNVALKPGLNVRMFTDVNLDGHGDINYDRTTGHLRLEPGTYRVDGWSLTTFGFKLTPEQRAAAYSAPGYAFLWNLDKNEMELLASVQDPLDSTTSNINGVLTVARTTQYYFGHQNGDKVDGISLQLYDPNITLPNGTPSTNHAFAQLVIERL